MEVIIDFKTTPKLTENHWALTHLDKIKICLIHSHPLIL